MLQIKCGKCGVVINIEENSFVKDRNCDNNKCFNCCCEIPEKFLRVIKLIIEKDAFRDWDIGTFFKT